MTSKDDSKKISQNILKTIEVLNKQILLLEEIEKEKSEELKDESFAYYIVVTQGKYVMYNLECIALKFDKNILKKRRYQIG